MNTLSSKLFGRSGYISIKEYVDDIERMRKHGPWKLPLGISDRLQLFFLKIVIKFSWFAEALYILHTSNVSPAYEVLLAYAQKKQLVDSLTEGNPLCRGSWYYSSIKRASVNNYTGVLNGYGVAEDRATAFSKALGEMIERTVSDLYDTNTKRISASPKELMKKHPILYPPRYHRFLAVQKKKFKELRYDPVKPIIWVEGKNLITRKKTYIPRDITSWLSERQNGGEIFMQATTNGAAGYFTKAGAVLRGLLEGVQRDAFLVHWLTMIPPQIIIRETLPQGIQEKIQEVELFGISLSILDTTSIPVPSVCIVAISARAEIPQVVVSAASAVTFGEAIQSALTEMILMSGIFCYEDNKTELKCKNTNPEPFVSDLGIAGRSLYWRGVEKVAQLQWFLSGERVSYSDVCKQDIQCGTDDADRLRKCLGILKNLGEEYYPIVYYPENKIQEEMGFFVAHVYIPKAFPLYLFEGYGTFDSDRLQEFALSKNVPDWKLNPLPHMFA